MATDVAVGVEMIRMVRANRRTWALLPLLTDRILAFAERSNQQEGPALAKQFEAAFVLASDQQAAWVFVDPDGRLCGHLLGGEALYDGRKVAMVYQLWCDPGAVPLPVQREAALEMEQWARNGQCQWALMLTPRNELGAWDRIFGLTPFRYLMRKDLMTTGGNGG